MMEQYGIVNGSVFTIEGCEEEFVICDLVTHCWKANVKRVALRPYPYVVFRRVTNINERRPVHEQIEMPLPQFKKLATIKPLTSRI